LGQVQVTSALTPSSRDWLDRLLQRAGIERRNDRLLIWLVIGLLTALLCGRILGWAAGVGLVLLAPLLIWLFLGWRYLRRLQRMIEQLPVLLDHSVRSLKAGRTLNDAVLGAIDASRDPLHGALQRVRRNVQMGVSLDGAMSDLAELY
ncbi:type II secretion system protein F, partial [Pseudomonas frederiksbergensis]|nr:type II secretion system protein F [Pseudomonas frederiksbergensis]